MFILQLCFYVIRSALVATSIVVTGWFLAVSPTADERRLVSASATSDDMRLRKAVVELRLAQAALALAPDLAVSLIHRQGGGVASRAEVEQGLRAIAAGRRIDAALPSPARTQRQSGGAKFLTVPQG